MTKAEISDLYKERILEERTNFALEKYNQDFKERTDTTFTNQAKKKLKC